eukprot:Clim_evm11s167 gene=Clim_evmTU11s167
MEKRLQEVLPIKNVSAVMRQGTHMQITDIPDRPLTARLGNSRLPGRLERGIVVGPRSGNSSVGGSPNSKTAPSAPATPKGRRGNHPHSSVGKWIKNQVRSGNPKHNLKAEELDSLVMAPSFQCDFLPQEWEGLAKPILLQKGSFCTWSQVENKSQIMNRLQRIGIGYTEDQAASLRAQLLQMKVMFGYSTMTRKASELSEAYEHGDHITVIAKRFDVPPCGALRTIWAYQGWSKDAIKRFMKNPHANSSNASHGLAKKQLEAAELVDSVTGSDQSETQKQAQQFESIISKELSAVPNLRFKTENQQRVEARKNGLVARITPDFRLDSPLRVSNCAFPINWIDAKNFMGTDQKIITARTLKQCRKYVSELGSGAIVFRWGVNGRLRDVFHREGILLLSYPFGENAKVPDAQMKK